MIQPGLSRYVTITLGQAKLIIRFLFQGFQNSMRAGGHFSLFIIDKTVQKTSLMQ